MPRRPTTWGDLLDEVRAAIAAEDWARGEDAIAWLRQEAGHRGDLGQESSALFYEGMLADAKGDLARAELCFAEAVEVDKRHFGPVHRAVGDALNSLAMVREAMGKWPLAMKSRIACAEVYDQVGAEHTGDAFVRAGTACLRAKDPDRAEAMFERGLTFPLPVDQAWSRIALLGLHDAHLQREQHAQALRACLEGLREPYRDEPAYRPVQGRLWVKTGHLSWMQGLDDQVAFAYACAARLADDDAALADEAARGLARVPRPAPGRLDVWTVVYADPARQVVHAAHITRGLRFWKELAASVGDVIPDDQAPTR